MATRTLSGLMEELPLYRSNVTTRALTFLVTYLVKVTTSQRPHRNEKTRPQLNIKLQERSPHTAADWARAADFSFGLVLDSIPTARCEIFAAQNRNRCMMPVCWSRRGLKSNLRWSDSMGLRSPRSEGCHVDLTDLLYQVEC